MKIRGSTPDLHLELMDWSTGWAGGIPGVAVKCVDIRRNTGGEGGLLDCNKSEEIKSKETGLKIGQKTRVKVRKNRYGPDNCEFSCKIYFGDER